MVVIMAVTYMVACFQKAVTDSQFMSCFGIFVGVNAHDHELISSTLRRTAGSITMPS